MINLKELDLSKNKIRQLNPTSFSSKMNLKCLKLDHNGLKFFPDLTHIPKLTHLFANYNRLSDYNDIEKLRGVLSLKELELIHNPLSRRSGYREYIVRNIP